MSLRIFWNLSHNQISVIKDWSSRTPPRWTDLPTESIFNSYNWRALGLHPPSQAKTIHSFQCYSLFSCSCVVSFRQKPDLSCGVNRCSTSEIKNSLILNLAVMLANHHRLQPCRRLSSAPASAPPIKPPEHERCQNIHTWQRERII